MSDTHNSFLWRYEAKGMKPVTKLEADEENNFLILEL